jgi:hypothetical protein
VRKLELRKDLGLQKRISFWSLLFKNMDLGIGDLFLTRQVKIILYF